MRGCYGGCWLLWYSTKPGSDTVPSSQDQELHNTQHRSSADDSSSCRRIMFPLILMLFVDFCCRCCCFYNHFHTLHADPGTPTTPAATASTPGSAAPSALGPIPAPIRGRSAKTRSGWRPMAGGASSCRSQIPVRAPYFPCFSFL